MQKNIKKKLKHLQKNFNFKKEDLVEIEKMYRGDFFDPNDQNIIRLYEISKSLCNELTNLKRKKVSFFEKIKLFFRKQKIINLLFPIKTILADVGEDIEVVIGLVDFFGCGFINRDVHFSKYTLVECQKFSIFAARIKVGNNEFERKNNLIKLSKIHIGNDTWICAGVKINNNVNIAPYSVIGAGAIVNKDTEESSLNVGRPSKKIDTITKDYINKKKEKYNHSEYQKHLILNHLHKLGFKGKNKEYFKLLNGEDFNNTNLTLARIYLYTHQLCSEYNSHQTKKKRKKEILDILFPIHGKNLKVGKNLFVDLIGTTIIGNNVTIGDNAILAGNVVIEDNVTIGNNALCYSTGHDLYYQKRRTGFSFKYGFYEFSRSDLIQIKKNVHIKNNVIIAPSTIVNKNVDDNILVVKNKRLP